MNTQQSIEHNAKINGAIVQLLIEKGVFTETEFRTTLSRITAAVDQAKALERENFLQTDEGKAAQFLGKLMGTEI